MCTRLVRYVNVMKYTSVKYTLHLQIPTHPHWCVCARRQPKIIIIEIRIRQFYFVSPKNVLESTINTQSSEITGPRRQNAGCLIYHHVLLPNEQNHYNLKNQDTNTVKKKNTSVLHVYAKACLSSQPWSWTIPSPSPPNHLLSAS